jgi:hypothetical protein
LSFFCFDIFPFRFNLFQLITFYFIEFLFVLPILELTSCTTSSIIWLFSCCMSPIVKNLYLQIKKVFEFYVSADKPSPSRGSSGDPTATKPWELERMPMRCEFQLSSLSGRFGSLRSDASSGVRVKSPFGTTPVRLQLDSSTR